MKKLMTVKDMADRYQCSEKTARRYMRQMDHMEKPLRVTETIFDGTAQVPYYVITPVAVTADNLDEVIIDSGFHRREDVYLNVNASENITGDEHE